MDLIKNLAETEELLARRKDIAGTVARRLRSAGPEGGSQKGRTVTLKLESDEHRIIPNAKVDCAFRFEVLGTKMSRDTSRDGLSFLIQNNQVHNDPRQLVLVRSRPR